MKKLILVPLLAISCLTFQACSSEKKASDDSVENAENANEQKEDQASAPKEDDSEFAVKAASGGMTEVELGRMAQQKAQNAEVKKFAAQMVEDHSKANEELKALAASKNITLPTAPGEDHRKDIDEIAKLSGADFDKKYISFMKEDHEEDVKEFRKAADDAKDPDLKAFASKTLPTLQMHLDMVTALDKKIN